MPDKKIELSCQEDPEKKFEYTLRTLPGAKPLSLFTKKEGMNQRSMGLESQVTEIVKCKICGNNHKYTIKL